MKKFNTIVLFLALLLIAPSVEAHTHLQSTNPADGEVVTSALSSISLTYDGKIENGSSFRISASEGENIEVQAFTIENNVLTGTLAQSLKNDEYTVIWSSISQDGHPMTGEFSFSVNVLTEEAAEQNNSIKEENESEQAAIEEKKDNKPREEKASSNNLLIVLGLLAAIVIFSSIIFLKRKK